MLLNSILDKAVEHREVAALRANRAVAGLRLDGHEADIRHFHQAEILSLKRELEVANALVSAKNTSEDKDATSLRMTVD